MRKAVAVFFHVPGLRLFYGFRPDRDLLRVNLAAVAATLVLMACAGFVAPLSQRFWAVFGVWVIGHMAWGAYLSTRIS